MNIKNLLKLCFALCSVGMIFISCRDKEPEPKKISVPNNPEGVVINGIRWATCNVGSSGAFVSSPEIYGELYTWGDAPGACPAGWRLPTYAELVSLAGAPNEWVSVNGIKGRVFGSDADIIFLPAAGYNSYGGTKGGVGSFGYYWSCTAADEPLACCLDFYNNGVFTFNSNNPKTPNSRNRAFLYSLRCVVDLDVEPEPEPELE